MEDETPSVRRLARSVVRVAPGHFDVPWGVRGALIVCVPLALGLGLHLAAWGVLATLSALNLLLVEFPRPGRTSPSVLWLGVGANTVAFAGGTFVALLPGLWEIPLIGAGVFLALLGSVRPALANVSFTAAVMFVVGTGLPGVTLVQVGLRPLAIAFGGAWCLAAVVLHAALARRYAPTALRSNVADAPSPPPPRASLRHIEVVSVAVALSFAVGLDLHFARDFWIMLTVLVSLRLDLATTTAYSTMRTLGTVAGAAVAFVVTSYVAAPAALFAILVLATVLVFASRDWNYTVYALWITLFVIVLLNLSYAGGPALALTRVLDTAIGGAIAFVTALFLWFAVHGPARRARGRSGATS